MRLINAHKLIMHLNDWMFAEGCEDGWNYEKDKTVPDYERQRAIYNTINQCIQAVMDQHAVEAEPVRHGRWEWVDAPVFGNPYGSYKCDCGNYVPHKTNYCPNCGAKMDGGTL